MKSTILRVWGILLLVPLLCGAENAQSQSSKKTRIHIENDGRRSYHWIDGRYSLKVELEGDIEWGDNDREVRSISRGGYLEVTEKMGRKKHHIMVEAASGGGLSYKYRRNGRKVDFDEDGEEWLAEVLPRVIRESGMGAESRTKRMLRQEGVEGVLDEIELINAPSSKKLYMLYLFENAELNESQVQRAARLATDISSPGDKSRFLQATARYFFSYSEAVEEYFEAVESISSPGDKTRTLIYLVEEDLLNEKRAYLFALETARGISSPGDKARFLLKADPFYVPTAASTYFDVVDSIHSPGDKARVLINVLENVEFDAQAMKLLMQSTKAVSSPGDKARVLIASSGRMQEMAGDREVVEAFFDAASSISSPGDHARVLIRLLQDNQLSDQLVISLLKQAEQISSPGDKTRVLLSVAERASRDDELVEAYLKTAETISSPGDRRRALAALME